MLEKEKKKPKKKTPRPHPHMKRGSYKNTQRRGEEKGVVTVKGDLSDGRNLRKRGKERPKKKGEKEKRKPNATWVKRLEKIGKSRYDDKLGVQLCLGEKTNKGPLRKEGKGKGKAGTKTVGKVEGGLAGGYMSQKSLSAGLKRGMLKSRKRDKRRRKKRTGSREKCSSEILR